MVILLGALLLSFQLILQLDLSCLLLLLLVLIHLLYRLRLAPATQLPSARKRLHIEPFAFAVIARDDGDPAHAFERRDEDRVRRILEVDTCAPSERGKRRTRWALRLAPGLSFDLLTASWQLGRGSLQLCRLNLDLSDNLSLRPGSCSDRVGFLRRPFWDRRNRLITPWLRILECWVDEVLDNASDDLIDLVPVEAAAVIPELRLYPVLPTRSISLGLFGKADVGVCVGSPQ